MWRTIALTLLILAMPVALAQDQLNPTVVVTITEQDGGASIDAPAIYTVTVENTSPGSTTGQDPAMDIVLTVEGVPDGWQASLEPSTFRLVSGTSDTATLTVSVGPSASATNAELTVSATIYNGAFPPLELTGTGEDSVTVLRDDSTVRTATEFVGQYLWYIVGAALLLSILSMVMLGLLFRTTISIVAVLSQKTIRKGQTVKFPFTVKNHVSAASATISAEVDLPGWETNVKSRYVKLGKRGSSDEFMTIQAPATAKKGETARVAVTVTAGTDKRAATHYFDVTVN